MKLAFLLATVTALSFGLSACGRASTAANGPTQTTDLVLDWNPNPDHGGLYTAIRRGYFAQQGVRVVPRVPSDTTAQISLVAAGKADFGITYEADLLSARAAGIPVRSVMCLVQHPLNTVMALKRSGITRPRQLAGKTIGMAGSPSDRPLVAAMMAHDGASIDSARMVNVGYSLLPVLLAGRVDAVIGVYWTWEAIQARNRGYPVNMLRVERWGVPNYCELVLISSESTIRHRPGLVRSVVVGMQQGYAYAAAHPETACAALHAADRSLKRRLVLTSLRLLGPAVTDTTTVGRQDPAQWRAYAAWLHKTGLLKKPVTPGSAFTNHFLATRR